MIDRHTNALKHAPAMLFLMLTLGLPNASIANIDLASGLNPPLPPVQTNPLVNEDLIKVCPIREKSVGIPDDKCEYRRTIHRPIFVIHETAMSGHRTEQIVTKPHYDASFHVLIRRDGTIIYMVPPHKTAFTAGHSQFQGEYDFSGSGRRTVNHMAYQVELESPEDGYWCEETAAVRTGKCVDGGGRSKIHSGYSDEQYVSLAWLAVKTGVEKERITTHAAVDLSGTRTDPRSFNWDKFWAYFDAVPDREQTIYLGNEQKPLFTKE
jgi:N-acetyl-anhydromuramyl-L-alanine amidase AmpD